MFDGVEYDAHIERIRQIEYPQIGQELYLDHAGTTLYSKTLMERFQATMMSHLYGNPHSASSSSLRSTQEIEAVRHQALRYFGFDPDLVALVFTSNTTSAIKLVTEAFRDRDDGFWFGYHAESHTSLVGVRELAAKRHCFESDSAVEEWLNRSELQMQNACRLPALFAYPAQSNMSGRRLPLDWIAKASQHTSTTCETYTLLDAASYAATSPFAFEQPEDVPDFTVLSFSKVFGFPDLGALIVKKDSAHVFDHRKYFGGGTVDMVLCVKEQWHATKAGSVHSRLEDGTLPIHSILALKLSMETHDRIFSSLHFTSQHVSRLTQRLHAAIEALRHANGQNVCRAVQRRSKSPGHNPYGPIVTFNVYDSRGSPFSTAEVEKLASIQNIHLRTGGHCNPGGVALSLGLEPWEMRENFSAGFKCGSENDIINGKPTGLIRVSLGAMSTACDVDRFVSFLDEYFVDRGPPTCGVPTNSPLLVSTVVPDLRVESIAVYPIKSCAGWRVPPGMPWDIRDEGLAWDREWCLVKRDTGVVLSQKAFPRMALIQPELDFRSGVLRIGVSGSADTISVPLSRDPKHISGDDFRRCNTIVCGDTVHAAQYTSPAIADFFTKVLDVPCVLARFPAASKAAPSSRHSKLHTQHNRTTRQPLLMSNESPILTISRSSLNRLNEIIKAQGGKAAHASVFRANIVVAEHPSRAPGQEQPWAEDVWSSMRIGGPHGPRLEFLGGCRRCQMICIDQKTAERSQEPFSTLAKLRRINGRVMFGVHTSLSITSGGSSAHTMIQVGDAVDICSDEAR